VILRLTVVFVALPLTLFVLAVLLFFFGCFSRASEFERESYDSPLPGDVDRAFSAAGTIVVMDVESGEILAAKSLGFPGKQLMRPGSTRKPFALMDLTDSGLTGPEATIHLPSAASHRGMELDCGHTADVSQLAGDAMVLYLPEGRGGDAAMVAHSVFEEYRQIKKKP
jgi:hypothetical protein